MEFVNDDHDDEDKSVIVVGDGMDGLDQPLVLRKSAIFLLIDILDSNLI